MAFNVTKNAKELLERYRAYAPILRSKADEGYDWLDGDSFCIELPNPHGDHGLVIEYNGAGETVLCFSHFHAHYGINEPEDHDRMYEQLEGILNNDLCCASLFCGDEQKWLCSTMIGKDKTPLPVKEIFHIVYEDEKYETMLHQKGGEARFIFWDRQFNKTLKV